MNELGEFGELKNFTIEEKIYPEVGVKYNLPEQSITLSTTIRKKFTDGKFYIKKFNYKFASNPEITPFREEEVNLFHKEIYYNITETNESDIKWTVDKNQD